MNLAGFAFALVGGVEPLKSADGSIVAHFPQPRYRDAASARLNPYGAGPFCRFSIAKGQNRPGLYVLAVEQMHVYAGECENLAKRFGPNGYGAISPRNCFVGGQPTNCRVNALIMAEAASGANVELWFHEMVGPKVDRLDAETKLIRALRPPWNLAKMR